MGVLGIGTSLGFSSIIVPGSGEPNYDLFEADPFETRKGRNNKIVHQLLDKLTPEMIQMDASFIASTPSRTLSLENKYALSVKRNKDQKWARKSVTKNVKQGYRGVLKKRYSKYHHMKDLHLRQEKVIKQLNARKKKLSAENKDRIVKVLTKRKDQMPAALDRFNGPKKSNHQ